ncbi:MAG: hypothetical protein AAF585_12040 [Verrucomicrobiota bacterium]
MSADIDNATRYHLSSNPDGSFLELEQTECSRGYLAFDGLEQRFVAFYLLDADDAKSRKATISLGERVFLASEIDHPSVFALRDYGDYKGQFFYTTELIDGERLGPYLDRVGGLPLTVSIDLSLQLVRLLRYLGDYPRVLGTTDISDMYVSYTPGQSLRLRFGGLGLNRPEQPQTEIQICERWIPESARILWELIAASLRSKDGQTLPEKEVAAFLSPFQEFIELLTSGKIQHSADDLYHLEQEFTKYAFEYLNVFQDYLQASNSRETVILRPQSFLADLLMKELFLANWEDHDYVFDNLLISHCSNFAVAAHDSKKNREIQFQILPPDRLKGPGGLESLHRKMGHPYLMEHPNFVRTYFLRQEGDFLVVGEERVNGFNLAHLLERRGSLFANETLQILRKLHWILRQVEGIGVPAEELKPWNVYFQFQSELSENAMIMILSGATLRRWPPFEIKLHVGVTTSDFVRPARCVWQESIDRLTNLFREREPEGEPRNLTFVALAAYMLDYRNYWQDLFGEARDESPLTECPKFNTLAVASVEPTRGEPKDERNRFLREWEARMDTLNLAIEENLDEEGLIMVDKPPQNIVSPFRDLHESKGPTGLTGRISVASAAAVAAEAARPESGLRKLFKPSVLGLFIISVLGGIALLGYYKPAQNSAGTNLNHSGNNAGGDAHVTPIDVAGQSDETEEEAKPEEESE